MRNTVAASGSPCSRSLIVMNMSGAKMSARLPTLFHDGGSILRPPRVRIGPFPFLLLETPFSGSSTSTSWPSSST